MSDEISPLNPLSLHGRDGVGVMADPEIKLKVLLKNFAIQCRFLKSGEWCELKEDDPNGSYTNCRGDILKCEVEKLPHEY